MRHSGRNDQLPKTVYTITVDVVHALVVERESLRSKLQERDAEIEALRTRLQKESGPSVAAVSEGALSARADTTYLNVIGGLLDLLLGNSPAGQPHSVFRTQQSVIDALVAGHGTRLGIAQRTLERKFAAAKRHLTDSH